MHVLMAAAEFAAQVPDPGSGEAPPGTDGIETLLRWLAWIVFAACIAGVLIAAISMAINHQRGGIAGEGVNKLAWALGAAVVGASASGLVGALV